jgi:calcineurin-like phosphoesterase family protein
LHREDRVSNKVWYTSDLHIGHKLVAGLRGFWDEDYMVTVPVTAENPSGAEAISDTTEHDEWLADLWDSTVAELDQVFILGDISINGGQHALDWINARPGRKHLIFGNHDPAGPWDRRAVRLQPIWAEYFETMNVYLRRKLNGVNFMLSHFPYMPYDRVEPRFEQYRVPNLGLPLVHGHVHSDQKTEFPNHFHVGIDAHKALVPQDEIQDWLLSLKEAS